MLTVYSCIAGGYDDAKHLLSGQPRTWPDVRFCLYTDTPGLGEYCNGWQIKPFHRSGSEQSTPQRVARWHKLNAHLALPLDTEYSIWIDGSQKFKLDVDPWTLLQRSLPTLSPHIGLAAFKHPQRNCIYQELEACLKLKKDEPQLMREQIARYRTEGYPAELGLVETACVVRRHSAWQVQFNTAWWRELAEGSVRDQLSFNYVAWKTGTSYGHVPGRRDRSDFFEFLPHWSKA
jgi:hypothetical protein